MKEKTNEMKKEKIDDLLPGVLEMWSRSIWKDDLHGRSELEGVAQRTDSHLTHLTNSLPALSLCVTGRGESWGNGLRGVR